jgi:transposase
VPKSLKKLSSDHLKAAELIAEGVNFALVADRLGVSRRTIDRWLLRPDVKQHLAQLQQRKMQANQESLASKYQRTIEQLAGLGLNTVARVLKDPDAKKSDKLKAVDLVGKWYGLDAPVKHQVEVGVKKELNATLASLEEKMSAEAFNELIGALISLGDC